MGFSSRFIFMLAVWGLFAFIPTRWAVADIFKCEVDGRLVLQDAECPKGVEQSIVDVVIQNDKPKYQPFERDKYDESQFSAWENVLIKAGKVEVGMSKEALEQSWGWPLKINRSSYGPEQWVFLNGIYQRYAYVRDGKVTAWQD
jgi:hypothetical protein